MMIKKAISKLINDKFLARNFSSSFEMRGAEFDVNIDGFGSVELPIQPKMARQLIDLACPSKFGFKEETLYDPAIRKSYEIDAKKIHIGEQFHKEINASLEIIKSELLFPPTSRLKAELHNMLIYEKGCFFDFHQDSEKHNGMMASLVVVLPSNYRGGELVIEYQGQKNEFGGCERHYSNSAKNNALKFIAFYADCLHQLKKITYGYRIALTFNLILENPEELKSKEKDSELTCALDSYFSTKADLPDYLRDDPKWFVYLLNHQYTSKSLNWKTLKGVDKEAALAFKQAADDLDLDIYLTLADIQETWSVVEDDYYYSKRRYRIRDYEEIQNEEKLELEDLVNSETVLDNWIDKNGKVVDFASHYINDSMIFMTEDNAQYKPENSEYEGYMGNYGNTLDRWYKRSAIVMWPKKLSLNSMLKIDSDLGIKELLKIIRIDLKKGRAAYTSLKKVMLKRHLIDKANIDNLIELAIYLNDKKYFKDIISNCNTHHFLNVHKNKLRDLLVHYGDKDASNILKELRKEAYWGEDKSKAYAGIIQNIQNDFPLTCETFMAFWLSELARDLKLDHSEADAIERRDAFIKKAQKILIFYVRTLQNLGDKSKLELVFDILYKNNKLLNRIFIYEVLHHIELDLAFKDLPKYQKLKEKTFKEVTNIIKNAPSGFDWSIDELPNCSCELCLELRAFLSCKSSQEKIWPISKEKRQHIHRIVEQLKLPVSHETLRQGSPYRLVLKKKDTLFTWRKGRLKRFEKLLKAACD